MPFGWLKPNNPNVSDKIILHGSALAELIASTEHPIKLFLQGQHRPCRKVSRIEALRIVKTGIFVGGGSLHRVRYIREVDPRGIFAWTKCWRTVDSAVIAFHNVPEPSCIVR